MTPKNREELVSLIDGYVEGVDGADVLADLESYGLRIVPVEPTPEMLATATGYHCTADKIAEANPVYWLETEGWRAMLAASPFAKEG